MMKKSHGIFLFGIAMVAAVSMIAADAPTSVPGAAPIVSFSATTANVMGAPDSIRMDVFRWSTDAERDQLMSAWMNPGSAGGGRGAAKGRAGAAGKGAAKGRGATPDPTTQAKGNAPAPAAGRGSTADQASGPSPEASLALALKQSTNVGYLWSSEVAGYAIRYSGKVTGADGSERVILITDRPLGKTNTLWTPVSGAPSTWDFSVIELRVNSKGEGEGKISLTGKVAPDSAAKIVAPESYATLPVILKNVKHRNEASK